MANDQPGLLPALRDRLVPWLLLPFLLAAAVVAVPALWLAMTLRHAASPRREPPHAA